MKTALIDTSSAILLYKADLFDKLVETWQIVVADAVFEEMTIPGYPGAEIFEQAVWEGQVRLQGFHADRLPEPHDRLLQEKKPGRGEYETLGLYLCGTGNFVIIDDGKAAAYCRDHGILYINALLFPRILYLSGEISGRVYRNRHRQLVETGRYSPQIIAWALACTRYDLGRFLDAKEGEFGE